MILINVWLRYTSVTSVVPIETTTMVRLNVLLLFLVAVEPYLFDIMVKFGPSADPGVDASAFYTLDIGGMNLVIAYFIHLMTREEKKLIFVFSAIPNFAVVDVLGTSLRVILWISTVPFIWISQVATKSPG